MGIYDVGQRPPAPRSGRRRAAAAVRRRPLGARVWILVSDDDSAGPRSSTTAEKLGATVLWRHHYWAEFNGFNSAFQDPWGNTLVLWTKGGDDPQIPEGFTRE